jgi:transposase
MNLDRTINLQNFFPSDDLKITSIEEEQTLIRIKLKSITHSCICNKCGKETKQYHGTYLRKVQDLPILNKSVYLEIKAHEYTCTNPKCEVKTLVENFNGFLNYYSRMTERCADFICTLALETSCEGCARICSKMNIKTSGDSIIRLLVKRYESQAPAECGSVIGVDDFSFKKRHTYGTIIVDEGTHKPIAILDGRDGKTLKEWLKRNRHVKLITRDRASAYAKVIEEVLPDAMQIADRFHLHQNLLDVIRKCINREIPATISIQEDTLSVLNETDIKKNPT